MIRPASITPRGELPLEAWESPTVASTIAIIPGIIAIRPTQGITASTKVITAVIRAAIPRFCPELFFTSSMTLNYLLLFTPVRMLTCLLYTSDAADEDDSVD